MKIEIGESLILSWLRHVKKSQTVQLNWKPSVHHWDLHHDKEIENVIQRVDNYFKQRYSYKVFKINSSFMQLLQQGEVDALGINVENGIVKNIYGIDVAFHENGLNYGSKTETIERILKKIVRTAMLIYGYFNVKKGNVIFASPKIYQSTCEPLLSAVEDLDKFLKAYGFDFNIKILANESFNEQIYTPVVNLSSTVADTSELFLRSVQLNNMFNITTGRTLSDVHKINTTKETTTNMTYDIPIGKLVQNTFNKLIIKNKLTREVLYHLCDPRYSKERFLLPYPMLKKIKLGDVISTQRNINGRPRYYSNPITIFGEKYLLCNHWVEKSRRNYMSWLNSLEEKILHI